MILGPSQGSSDERGKRVLVTDATYKHTLAAVRSLSRAGFDVKVMGHPLGQARFSKGVSTFFRQEKGDQGFIECLREIVLSDHIDAIIPVGAKSVFTLDEHREWLQGRVAFALAPHRSLVRARSKSDLLEFAADIGIGVPSTRRFQTHESLVSGAFGLSLPFVLKSDSEEHKFGPAYIYTKQDLMNVLEAPALLSHFIAGEILAQPLISGRGEGFFALYQDGVCKRLMMHRRVRESPSTGGSSWAAQSVAQTDLSQWGMALLDALEWHGPAMVEFKRESSTGRLVLMELNPKFWGSLDLAIACGVDFPSDTARVALGEILDTNYEFDVGKYFAWPLDNLKSYVADKELRDLRPKTNITWQDPVPGLVAILGVCAKPVSHLIVKSGIARQLSWIRRYSPHDFFSRFVGEIVGIPLRMHCQVNDFMWIGARPRAAGRFLMRLQRRKIVSLIPTSQGGNLPAGVIELPLDEFVGFHPEVLAKYTQVLAQIKESGSRVFIHCREGVGRAPSLAIAYLMWEGRSYEVATGCILRARPICSINALQEQSLRAFARYCKDARS